MNNLSAEQNEQRRINISELPKDIPDFSCSYEPKQSLVKKWLLGWILSATKKNTIKVNDIIPCKSDISEHLGVSMGTVQNAIRCIEDEGYLKSKQRTGTMISNVTNPISNNLKSTSKRDKTIDAIKIYIKQKNIKVGKTIPTAGKMAEILNISQNTVRMAYDYLEAEGILSACLHRGKDSNRTLKSIPEINEETINNLTLTADTLVLKLTEELKQYLCSSFNIGDKIPSHEELSKKLNVSIKTINDCIKNLSNEGILIARRGRYGTILASNPYNNQLNVNADTIFASAEEAITYSYQKIESQIYDLIRTEYKSGDKLPTMADLAKRFDVSTNTIRKALNNISSQGYLTFGRGRYGGTFVIESPEYEEKEAYQWLSINPDFISNEE